LFDNCKRFAPKNSSNLFEFILYLKAKKSKEFHDDLAQVGQRTVDVFRLLKPVEPDSLSLSDPAKSQQIECTATRLAGDGVGACDIEHEHPECNLDDLSLQFVAATAQFLHVVKIQVKIQLFV
jgi:hypothetical protein